MGKSTAFSDKERDDGSGKRDILFNRGEEDGKDHGHVVQSEKSENETQYHYVRDEDGNVYVDDSKD
jgi:hypothetical protein